MFVAAPRQPGEMAAAHQRARIRRRQVADAHRVEAALARNVEPVLSLGSVEFTEFRGRAYGVPPVPWKVGQRLNTARAEALDMLEILRSNGTDPVATARYYRSMRAIPPLLWANCFPTSKLVRILKRIPLLRYALANPFDDASDGELLEQADFFLARRMKSGGLSLVPQPTTNPARPTS